MEDFNPNDFNKKFNEFITELPGRMYIFEITKFCGYSTFIYMYKDETITDLYTRVSHHFSCNDIKGLYIDNHLYKYIDDAKKNLLKVPVMHGTIPHEQWAKQGAAKVLIKPAAHGAGGIAGGSMRAVLESAGITDVLAKSLGSANPHNVVKATIKALGLLREPIQIAKTRNIKLSKVFNG